ncbi:hypothetical protein TdN_01770 [Thermodesulfovibrio sp. TK110]
MAYILWLLIAIFALLSRIFMKSWFAPGAFFSIIWCFYTLLPLFLVPSWEFHPLGLLWILFACFIVFTGSLTGYTFNSRSISQNGMIREKLYNLNKSAITYSIFIFTVMSFGGILVLILNAGYNLSSLFSLTYLSEISYFYSFARYTDPSYREPILSIFLSSFTYSGAFLGGVLYAIPKINIRQRLFSILPLLVALLYCLVEGTRASIYFPIIMWISSYISTKILHKNKISLFSLKNIFLYVIGILGASGIYIFVQLLRWGHEEFNINNLYRVSPIFYSAFLGPPVLFSQWFSEHWYNMTDATFGLFTNPLLRLIFSSPRLRFESTSLEDTPGAESTVFTLFAEIIQDYTVIGAIFWLFILGFFAGWTYRQLLNGKIIYVPFMAIFYSVVICSLTGFLFSYTTIIFAWFMFLFCYKFAIHKKI